MRLDPGTLLLGRYRLKEQLGLGLKQAFRAWDEQNKCDVLMRILMSGAAGTDTRFRKELEILAPLRHPNIAGIDDHGEVDGRLYSVAQWRSSENLRLRISRERQLPIVDAVRIARQVAAALDHVHERGIVHHNVKPDNILLGRDGAMLDDFGLATNTATHTGRGYFVGTPSYMSPEHFVADALLDHRIDIYALGCVVYEMLVGEVPFTAPTFAALVERVPTEAPSPPHTKRPTIPTAVSQVVLRAIAKSPDDRFPTAGTFAEELTRAAAG